MGYPVFSFQLLESLFTQWNATAAERIDRDVLENFRAVAVVLFDPEQHADVQKVMDERFAELDRKTGSTLLFFSLVSARENIPQYIRDRPHYLRINEDLKEIPGPGDLKDIKKNLWFTLMALGLNSSELPGVVFFQPDAPETLYFTPVSARNVADVLLSITDLFEIFPFSELMGGQGWFTTSRGAVVLRPRLLEGSATHLAMLSSATLFGLYPLASWNQQRKIRVQDMVRFLEVSVGEIRRLAKMADEQLRLEMLQSLDRLVSVWAHCKAMLSLSSKPPRVPPYQIPGKLVEFLEPESQILIETVIEAANHQAGKHRDFAPLILSIGKILEVEAHHSLLHLIRDQVEIDARNHFMKVDPAYSSHYSRHFGSMLGGGEITIPRGKKKFDKFLNSSKDPSGKLDLPQIKELYDSLNEFVKLITCHPSKFSSADWATFETEREVLRQKRNDAAHELKTLPEPEFQVALSALKSLCDANFFEVSAKYKQAFRARGPLPVSW